MSIIIPAHNESSVIKRCCAALLDGALPKELEIIVVCNGCSDNTAELARSVSKDIKVLETDVLSKSNALNLGDQQASGYPRFYIDADIIIPLDSVRKTAAVLQSQRIFAAAPSMRVDLTERSFFVKAFYRVWIQLPYCCEGMVGSGVYALSEAGRKRFEDFPMIVADDGYVRLMFRPHERMTLPSCYFTIIPPKRLTNIIKIKSRAYFGTMELRQRYPSIFINEGKKHSSALTKFLFKPNWWVPLIIYCYVRSVSRLTAWYQFQFVGHYKWNRDETSR